MRTLLATRQSNMLAGIPDNSLAPIGFDLAGPANGKPGYSAWDKTNWAPRLAVAWSPHGEGGLWGKLTGGDKLVVRGGYSMVYDRIGQALAHRFDQGGSVGASHQAA